MGSQQSRIVQESVQDDKRFLSQRLGNLKIAEGNNGFVHVEAEDRTLSYGYIFLNQVINQ